MKITRNQAINMFGTLGQIALGKLNEDTLERTMHNFCELRKVADDFEALEKELFKRLYGDMETMEETERKDIQDFFGMLSKLDHAEDKVEMEQTIKAAYPKLYDLRRKEVGVIISLLNKEVEVEIQTVDEQAFTKGVIAGNKDFKTFEVKQAFAPLFEVAEAKETDLSELDELLK